MGKGREAKGIGRGNGKGQDRSDTTRTRETYGNCIYEPDSV